MTAQAQPDCVKCGWVIRPRNKPHSLFCVNFIWNIDDIFYVCGKQSKKDASIYMNYWESANKAELILIVVLNISFLKGAYHGLSKEKCCPFP